MAAVILEPKEIKSDCFHCFPIYLPWSDESRCHDLKFSECWVLSQFFHSCLSLSSRDPSSSLSEHLRIYAFELQCCRRLLRVPWTSRRSNHSILKEISPGCSLEGLILKLKLQYFGHLMWGADSLEKTQMLGKVEGRRRRGWQRMRSLDSISESMDHLLIWGYWYFSWQSWFQLMLHPALHFTWCTPHIS